MLSLQWMRCMWMWLCLHLIHSCSSYENFHPCCNTLRAAISQLNWFHIKFANAMHRCSFEMPKLTTILNEVKIMIGKFYIMNSMNCYTQSAQIHVWLVKYRLFWNCLWCSRCSILECICVDCRAIVGWLIMLKRFSEWKDCRKEPPPTPSSLKQSFRHCFWCEKKPMKYSYHTIWFGEKT